MGNGAGDGLENRMGDRIGDKQTMVRGTDEGMDLEDWIR